MNQMGFVDDNGNPALSGDEYEIVIDQRLLDLMIRKAWRSKTRKSVDGPLTVRFRTPWPLSGTRRR